jgi:hypothetical protein
MTTEISHCRDDNCDDDDDPTSQNHPKKQRPGQTTQANSDFVTMTRFNDWLLLPLLSFVVKVFLMGSTGNTFGGRL